VFTGAVFSAVGVEVIEAVVEFLGESKRELSRASGFAVREKCAQIYLSNILIVLSSTRFPSRHDKQHFSGQVTTHERTRQGYAKTTGRLFHLYASFETTNELFSG
jgi:hypothetical protein